MLCQKRIHIPFGDRNFVRGKEQVLALIFLAHEMKQQIPKLMLDDCVELKKVIDRLVKRCLILPKGSIPYFEMVRELHSWMGGVMDESGQIVTSSVQCGSMQDVYGGI
jgi:hypothetical protein